MTIHSDARQPPQGQDEDHGTAEPIHDSAKVDQKEKPKLTLKGLLDDYGKSAAMLFAAMAGIAYVLLRLVYTHFYSRFAIEPEDVGLGRTETLTQALVGPALLAAAVAF